MRDDAWIRRRTALHDRYLEVARIGDASRLAYLHGPPSVWSEEEVAGLWEQGVRKRTGALEPLNCVYVHVPFCKSICSFCNYDRLQPSSPQLLENWLARALRSIEVMAPALRPLTFHTLYLGGGTPSVLPARMLTALLGALDAALSWHAQAARKLEFDPAVMNRERLEVLAAHRFDQLSFGIETLDPDINARHNRGRQGIEVIERCFRDLQAVGMKDVACDILLGLEGTTPEGMLGEMETILSRFRPAWVDIFMLTPTHAYVADHFAGSWETCWAHLRRFEDIVPPALPELASRTDYVVRTGQGHHMLLERREGGRPQQYCYTPLTSEARRPLNVFGLGRSARSSIFATAAFALCDPGDSPWNAGPAEYRGNAVNLADEARTFLVHLLRDRDTVDRAEFQQIFGADMTEVIPAALTGWESEGSAQLERDVLRFVPQDRRARIRSLLWLASQEGIEYDLAHFAQVELSASGVAELVAPIEDGAILAGGHTFAGTEGTRLLIRTPTGEMLRLRVAPALTDGVPFRLVLEGNRSAPNDDSLRRTVSQLRAALIRRHRDLASQPSPS